MAQKITSLMLAILLGIGFTVLIIIATIFLLAGRYNFYWGLNGQNQTSCTQEAKICPDGSSVGRTGPNCEFAQCPNNSESWNTVRNNEFGFSFRYPSNFFDQNRQPQILTGSCNIETAFSDCSQVTNVLLQNNAADNAVNWQNASGQALTVNNTLYLSCQSSDAGAGHLYTHYHYLAIKNNKCLVVVFDTDSPNCQNYLPLEPGNIEQEQNYNNCISKNNAQPGIVQQIANTFTFEAQ